MKRLFYSVAFILLLWGPAFAVASDDSLFAGMGSGLGITFGPGDKMCHPVLGELPFTVSIGYSFSRFTISLEGVVSWPFVENAISEFQMPGLAIGSIVGSYSFLDNDLVRAYALLGVGTGFGLLFSNCEDENDSDNDGSGPVQLQTGIGLSVSVLSWLELSTETRLRLGMPNNTDVVTLTQHFGVVFRF